MNGEYVYLLCYDDEDSGLSETMGVFSTLEKVIDFCEKHGVMASDITEKSLRDYCAMTCEVMQPTVIYIDGQHYGFLQDHQLGSQSISIQLRRVY